MYASSHSGTELSLKALTLNTEDWGAIAVISASPPIEGTQR